MPDMKWFSDLSGCATFCVFLSQTTKQLIPSTCHANGKISCLLYLPQKTAIFPVPFNLFIKAKCLDRSFVSYTSIRTSQRTFSFVKTNHINVEHVGIRIKGQLYLILTKSEGY